MTQTGVLVPPDWRPDRAALKDSAGKLITQGLFLEFEYNPERAIYTFKDEDYEYKGKVFPSARRLFLSCNDPTGYIFSVAYLWGWDHWKQMKANKRIAVEVEKWEEELEIKLRAIATANMITASSTSGAAAKWVSEGKWKPAKPGRPTKKDMRLRKAVEEMAAQEAKEDADRLGLGNRR